MIQSTLVIIRRPTRTTHRRCPRSTRVAVATRRVTVGHHAQASQSWTSAAWPCTCENGTG